jgi:hypothetical protein
MQRSFAIGLAVVICLLVSCQKASQPAPALSQKTPSGTVSKQDSPDPVLEITNRRQLDFGPGIEMTRWDFRASRVQELTVRLLVMKDGKSEQAQEVACKWDQWPQSDREASWHLHYLLQDGDPFGAKNKRLPAITLSFDAAAPTSSVQKRSHEFVEGEFGAQQSASTNDGALNPARPHLVYYRFYDPAKGDSSVTLSGTVESLTEASKDGRTAVAIVVEWKPAEKNN